ncbi:PREDICTED: microtubule-associated protein Jupiter isoform X5 [Habropoda laboriosa]|uniref:microtubule-associated protein Jupiter isoform X5 n=1 Tax=Habropoda laboriosa TaxID=597456 RepID=UPI00083CB2F2|nr:PREDICTED: microtubule-associated protein Jupiter isoform X5 [Habropoda laboriosa]
MATYATYRHVELDNVGYGKKRVLKPPGGGSSDIFGAAPEETSPRRVKNHNQSQLGSALFGETPNSNSNSNETPRNKPGNDSYNRLFGPPDAPPTTPNAKNHMRSNISLSGESTSSSMSSGAATSPAKSTASSDSIAGVLNGYVASNGNNLINDVTDGNPVTGTGYAETQNNHGPAVQNGTSSSNSSEKSNDTSPAAKLPARARVPPGGYSSGLW